MTTTITTSAPRDIRPFPFAALDSVTAEEATFQRAMRRHAESAFDLHAIARAASELTGGASTELLPRRVRLVNRPRGADDFVGVALTTRETRELEGAIVVEAEGALAAAIARRALKRPPLRVFEKGRPPSAELIGAFAAIAGSVARKAHARTTAQMIAAGPGAALVADLLRVCGDAFTLSFTVLFENEGFEARVTAPRALLQAAPSPQFDRAALLSLGEMPIALPIVAARSSARARDVADLMPGDAFMPGAGALSISGGVVRGPITLCAPAAELGLAAHADAADKLTFAGELVHCSWSEESMQNEAKTEVAVADAPVVVRVEIGAAELSAREWAALTKGDTISLKKRLGEAVTLRVSGVEVARGELVQIDGEVGVRILARIG